jgi:predicted nucleic acid-binding protein
LSTYALHDSFVCNTTPIRHFALSGHFDLLVQLLGGVVRTPRTVFDPDEDSEGDRLVSEVGQSERYWAYRATSADRTEKWGRLRALRTRDDIEAIDLAEDELATFAELQTPAYARSIGFAVTLGAGEAAVVAVAESRGWAAVMDDAAGREAFHDKVPAATILTSRELLRAGVGEGLLTSPEADLVYADLIEGRYRGPQSLWG